MHILPREEGQPSLFCDTCVRNASYSSLNVYTSADLNAKKATFYPHEQEQKVAYL